MGVSSKARQLAEWLRTGRDARNVEHDEGVDVMEVYGRTIYADTIGLILIGKLGKDGALRLFKKLRAKYGDFNSKEFLYAEIGLTCDDGCCLHNEGWKTDNTEEFIKSLEDGGIDINLIH